MSAAPDISAVKSYLLDLQDRICEGLAAEEGTVPFATDEWDREAGGGGRTRILADGAVIEKGGVAFSHVFGDQLPPSASAHRPDNAGKPWQAMGVSLVIHPRNPYAPTSHANVRFFIADPESDNPTWWFGGGFDLTPYYGFAADAKHWHQTAFDALAPFGPTHYPRLKKWCDDYFFLKHRQEPRGIGGLFFDDFNELGFEQSFALMRSVGDHFLPAYQPILARRKDTAYGRPQREWQRYRRGRYVEFNLVWDRGTLFGLQSGGRTESILMSLPPDVSWKYDYHPEPGSPEADLMNTYLKPQNWLESADGST